MTQAPFGTPAPAQRGAVDLTRSAAPGDGSASGSYALEVTSANFQDVMQASLTAPVLLVFHSATRMPESVGFARSLAALADGFEGRFLVGSVDVDAQPALAQAVQLPSVPYVFAVVDGRPQPLINTVVPEDQLQPMLAQLAQQLTMQGVVGRHQPRVPGAGEDDEPADDPRYAAAQDALARDDVDGAIAEYRKLVEANPADAEAAAGLAMAQLLKRTQGVDLNAARAAAAATPDDVDAQCLVADLDLLGGHVEDAFARLVSLVSRTAGDDRDRAREHLIVLFQVVGNDDPRVQSGRRALASALF